MSLARILILGAGYTGSRVAALLSARGHQVVCMRSAELPLPDVSALRTLPGDRWHVLHSIPPVTGASGLADPTPLVVDALGDRVARWVYLSTTGVYGAASLVDETTPVAPRTEREHLRVSAERALLDTGTSTLILRPAAIYGPGRGAHVAIREGTWKLAGDGRNVVSRIHVDDLARLASEALVSPLIGAFPVADDEPCASVEVTQFCCGLLGAPLPPSAPADELHETRRSDRRVDGRAVRHALGVELHYPSYRVGIPASLETESRAKAEAAINE